MGRDKASPAPAPKAVAPADPGPPKPAAKGHRQKGVPLGWEGCCRAVGMGMAAMGLACGTRAQVQGVMNRRMNVTFLTSNIAPPPRIPFFPPFPRGPPKESVFPWGLELYFGAVCMISTTFQSKVEGE